MAIDKYEVRRIRGEIRRVLMQYWDPIGIKGEPNAQTEYDAYLGGVYQLLVRRAPDEEIASHLCRIVEEEVGLRPSTGGYQKNSWGASCHSDPHTVALIDSQ